MLEQAMPRIPKLLICITFHYSDGRIPILKQTCSRLGELAETVDVVVLTNEQSKIPYLLRNFVQNDCNCSSNPHMQTYEIAAADDKPIYEIMQSITYKIHSSIRMRVAF